MVRSSVSCSQNNRSLKKIILIQLTQWLLFGSCVIGFISIIPDIVSYPKKLFHPQETANTICFLTLKEKRTCLRKRMNCENVDKLVTDPVTHFRIEDSSKLTNRIKRNWKTGSESLNKFFETVDLLFAVPNLRRMSKEELVLQSQIRNNTLSAGEDCDIYCFGLFE
jgi:hypothetical protein